MSYDPRNTFIISPNRKGDNPKRPDWRGEVNIEGKVYELAGWVRQKRDGSGEFISGPVKPKEPRQDPGAYRPSEEPRQPPKPQIPARREPDADEDVPF